MKLTLMRPDDSGHWFLCDQNGRDWRIVQKWEDHPGAAALFGWAPCECGQTDGTHDCEHRTADEMIQEARDFLKENIGEEIEAPPHIAEYFEQPDQPDVEEVVTDFDGVRLRSTFEVVEEEPGRLGFRIDGPVFEFLDDEDGEEPA